MRLLPDGRCPQLGPGVEFALYFAQDDAQEGALAFDGFLHPFELFGMGVSARFSAQRFALFGVALLEYDAGTFGGMDDLVPCNLQQATVHGVSDGFLLDGGVDDDAFEFGGFDGVDLHCRLDGEFEQLLQAVFAEGTAKASNLGGIARDAGVRSIPCH